MAPVTSQPSSDGLIDRLQTFVTDNKRAVLIGAGVAAVGVGYYVYSSKAQGSSGSSRSIAGGDATTTDGDSSKKKKSSSKSGSSKKKSIKDPDGPLLEERKPKSDPDAVVDTPCQSARCDVSLQPILTSRLPCRHHFSEPNHGTD